MVCVNGQIKLYEKYIKISGGIINTVTESFNNIKK